MFKTLYRCPRTVARHENGPLHESRLGYLEHLAAQGAALHTITAAAGTIYRAAIWLGRVLFTALVAGWALHRRAPGRPRGPAAL